jgi:hypothetical protein
VSEQDVPRTLFAGDEDRRSITSPLFVPVRRTLHVQYSCGRSAKTAAEVAWSVGWEGLGPHVGAVTSMWRTGTSLSMRNQWS